MAYQSWIPLAHRLADEARDIVAQNFRRQPATRRKADQSPVTAADEAVEARLRDVIGATHGDHGIIGEEYGSYQSHSEYCWVIDPIDGTRPFTCGLPTFGTLIGLLHHQKPVLGVMAQPFTEERWIGVRGEGTYYRQGGSERPFMAVYTSACAQLDEARLATTSPYLMPAPQRARFEHLSTGCGTTLLGGDCYLSSMLASGHLEILIECGLKAHDILPLLPILYNAGACVSDLEGQPLKRQSETYNVCITANETLHAAALARLKAG